MKIRYLFVIIILIISFSCYKNTLNIELKNNILTINGEKIDLTKNEDEVISKIKIYHVKKNFYGNNDYALSIYPINISYNIESKKFKWVTIVFTNEFNKFEGIKDWDYFKANINGINLDSNTNLEQVKKIFNNNKKIFIEKRSERYSMFFNNDEFEFLSFDKKTKKIITIQVCVNGFKSK